MSGKIVLLLMGFVFAFSNAMGAETVICPEGVGTNAGDEAQFVQHLGQWTVAICGQKNNTFNRDIYSDFNLFYFLEGKKPTKMPFESGAAMDYSVKKIPSGLLISEMVLIDTEWVPLFNRQLSCSTAGCKVSRKYCANVKLSKKPSLKQAHALIDSYTKEAAKKSSTGQATDPAELDIVLAAALSGDKKSIEAYQKNPGFRLDGAATEHYEYGKRTLRAVSKMKCRL